MGRRRADVIERQIEALFVEGTVAALDDAQLLERFAARRDERAFAALVERHGPMVLATCRGLLGDSDQADDVFQATFLVLARRAGAIRHPERLGGWLYGVARHAAARVKRGESRRLRREREAVMSRAHSDRLGEPALDREDSEALHQEIGRLAERYRLAVVLCDLQGVARAEAAKRLGWPLGTVNGRLSRAREILRRRLARRGITLTAGALAAAATVPEGLAAETVAAASQFAMGMGTAAAAAHGGVIAREVLRAMMLSRAAIAVAVGVGLIGAGSLGAVLLGNPEAGAKASREAEARAEAPPSPLDALKAAEIPADERLPGQPANLVAVLGEHRGRHGGAVRCLAISPDGKFLATAADQDKDIKLWDAQTLRLRARLVGHRASVNCIAISPDGKTLASGSSYGDFLLWELREPTPRGPTQLVTRGVPWGNHTTNAVAFAPDGKTMAVAGSSGGVALFDISGPAPRERTLLPSVGKEVYTLAFSPDGATLATGSTVDGSVRLWDIRGERPRERIAIPSAAPPGQPVFGPISLAFSPDGKSFAVAAFDPQESVRLWDLTGPRPVEARRLGIETGARMLRHTQTVAFAPDGKSLLFGEVNGSARLFDLRQDVPAERVLITASTTPVAVVGFTPDGKTLVTGGDDHLVRIWELTADSAREKALARGAVGGLRAVAFAPDGKSLAASGDDGIVRLWDLAESPASALKASVPARGPVLSLAFSPDGKTLTSGEELWAVAGARLAFRRPLGDGVSRSVAYAADGKTLISSGDGTQIRLWDIVKGEPRFRITLGGGEPGPRGIAGGPHEFASSARVAMSPDGKSLAFSAGGRSVRLWDLSGHPLRERARLPDTEWPISSLAFSPDGKTLAAGTNGGTLLWDLSGSKPRSLRSIKKCLGFSLAFTRDGARLIAADEVFGDGKPLHPSHPAVCVYEVATGERLHEWELSAPCWAIALAPDGRHVAAAKQDGVVDIYRLAPDR